jgi:CRP-like cAMP-binding protein
MTSGELGRVYQPGETVIIQGEVGQCMYVIQEGQAEVLRQDGDRQVVIGHLGEGDHFGEMALFERETRSATVRAKSRLRVLTVDKKALLRRIHEDPSLAFRIIQRLSQRVRTLNTEVTRLKGDS